MRISVVRLLLIAQFFTVGISAADSRVVTLPRITAVAYYAPRPKIPLSVRKPGLNAYGVFVMYVDPKTGRVRKVETEKSTGVPALDKSSIEAFEQWRFRPGSVTKVHCPVRFVRPRDANGSNQSLQPTTGRRDE
jgi:TonB family protein